MFLNQNLSSKNNFKLNFLILEVQMAVGATGKL
jgi:hypothetical protein